MSQIPLDQALQVAIGHHSAGQLRQAEQVYRQILSQVPNHPDALHLLGVLAGQAGQPDAGIELIQRAIGLVPTQASYHNNLGNLFMARARHDDAMAAFRRALELNPGYASAYNNLGNGFKQKGQLADAIAAYQQAIHLQPDYADAYNNLGNMLNKQRQFADALPNLRRAIELNPHLAEAHSNLGITLDELGQPEEAIESFQRAVALKPNEAALQNNLGIMLVSHGRAREAIPCFVRLLELAPLDVNAHINLATALGGEKRFPEAIAYYRRALELKPDHARAHYNLGVAQAHCQQLDDAIASFEAALRLEPNYPEAYNNLGNVLKDAGRIADAAACYRRAMERSPDFLPAHSNLLHTLIFHPDCDASALYEEHRRWNEQRGVPLKPLVRPHSNDRVPDRRLRIGYVSPDFRDHVVGRNMLPLFREHDRDQVEIFCYSNVQSPDAATEQFRGYASAWRDIQTLSDSAVADLIRGDAIDILVDLTLHLAFNRLLVFARRPAPVQLTFAGYPGTTGLTAMDYRFTDPYLDPPGGDVTVYSEESLRFGNSFWCYDPLGTALAVNPLPARSSGFITFGCLNNFCKINDRVLGLWAGVMREVPGSRLMMLSMPGSHRQRALDCLGAEGVASERVTIAGPCPRLEYLGLYQRIDIGLDSVPYNGHTTSLDSMWMGVPVVTLVGRTVVGRAGLSQLTNLGLPELIAQTPEEFIQISKELAADLPRLAHLRATLRSRMEKSPLMDAPRFARNMEAVYRQIWRRWCETPDQPGR